MVPDGQKVWTDGRTDWTDGQRQNYIPPTSWGDNNGEVSVKIDKKKKLQKEVIEKSFAKLNFAEIFLPLNKLKFK